MCRSRIKYNLLSAVANNLNFSNLLWPFIILAVTTTATSTILWIFRTIGRTLGMRTFVFTKWVSVYTGRFAFREYISDAMREESTEGHPRLTTCLSLPINEDPKNKELLISTNTKLTIYLKLRFGKSEQSNKIINIKHQAPLSMRLLLYINRGRVSEIRQ